MQLWENLARLRPFQMLYGSHLERQINCEMWEERGKETHVTFSVQFVPLQVALASLGGGLFNLLNS